MIAKTGTKEWRKLMANMGMRSRGRPRHLIAVMIHNIEAAEVVEFLGGTPARESESWKYAVKTLNRLARQRGLL